MTSPEQPPQQVPTEPEPSGKQPASKKTSKLGSRRGIETLFRTSYRTHIDLSSIADTKANIMISINGIILSIVLVAISSGIAVSWEVLAPLTLMLLTTLVSTVFAVLSARPRIRSSVESLEDIERTNSSLLFFGNFVNLSKEEYLTGMKDLLRESDRVYTNMILDLYGLGAVLDRKFRLLRTSYTVFMVGLTLTVVLFIIFHIYPLDLVPVE